MLGEAGLAEGRRVVGEQNPIGRVGVFGVRVLGHFPGVIEVEGAQFALFCRPHHHRFEVEVAVGDMDRNDASGTQVFTVGGEGLECEQVHRDGVAAKGVEDDDVVVLRRQFLER